MGSFSSFSSLAAGLLLAASCLSSCTSWRAPAKPSTLVILVESLGFNSFSCGDSNSSGEDVLFEAFCRESVRFTHAYAPSPMSQPTIASILTGLYPVEHGVRHNGPQALAARYETIGEKAREVGFRTSFFSGGPPIFRRSGFNQGMDVFEDGIPVNMKQIYRPASQVVNLFLNWQQSLPGKSPYLSFLFLADPQFVDQPTANELGEVRESSYQSQVMEVSESLSDLVRELKHRKVWDSTNIFLVGLNGFVSDRRAGEPGATNLFFESTRATLMLKPARKMKEGPYNWKIDSNVSLVDLGVTLFNVLGLSQGGQKSKLNPVSLEQSLVSPNPDWDSDRKILVESAWPVWKSHGAVRAALRSGPYFYLFDENDQLYNTLTDSLEVTPLLLAEPSVARLRDNFASTLRDLGYHPWRSRGSEMSLQAAKALLAQELWRDREPSTDVLNRLSKLSRRFPDDRELLGWRANLALQRADWVELKSLAASDRPAWLFVAETNLETKKKVELPKDACLKAMLARVGQPEKNCGDAPARDLLIWSDEKSTADSRNRAMDAFLISSVSRTLTDRIARADMVAGDVWDVSSGRWPEPPLSDLMLALPSFKKYRATVRAKIASESR